MLYKLNQTHNRNRYEKVKRVTLAKIGWKEKDLENLISNNIQDFISGNDLMTIFNERPRKEEPDILALDSAGDLYIFELKRWSGKQENLLQVLRYGQLFGRSNYDELNSMYQKYKPKSQLSTDHATFFFGKEDKALPEEAFNQNQHFVIVTNGVDQETIESIIYWKKNGLNIDAIVYWVFEIQDTYFIEFNMYSQIDDFLEYETNCYVLNTNYSNNPAQDRDMLEKEKAAAYNPGWQEKIQRLQKGDTVFLYRSGEGIVGYGIADGVLHKVNENGEGDSEYNMHLDNFVRLEEQPISAAKMKEIAGHGFNFRQTLFSISEEAANKIKEYATKKIKEKDNTAKNMQ